MGTVKTIKQGVILSTTVLAVTGAAYFAGQLPPEIKEVVRQVHVRAPEPTLSDLLETVPNEFGVNRILVEAILVKESYGGRKDAIRFEPGQMERAAKITKDKEQQRMYASSHCPMQVMGWHAPDYGLSWSDLYDLENCFDVGMAILRKCLDKQKTGSKFEKTRAALACYNGSYSYADSVLAMVGKRLIEENL